MNESSATPKRDWLAIRHQYEQGSMGQRTLARQLGIPPNTVMQRAMREKWIQRSKLVRKASSAVEARLKASIQVQVENDLAPYIEAEKARFTKRGIKLAKRGLTRVERFFRENDRPEAKAEAMISKAATEYHRMGRTALGMSDGASPTAPVNVNILTNRSAIQVVDAHSLGSSQDCE